MNQFQTERRLCWSYTIAAILLLVTVVSIAIPFHHWKGTLDVCPGSWLENTNCGCILFGMSTNIYFNGGHNSYCLYAVFAPLFAVAYAIIMAVFHMYRVCISNIGEYEDEKSTTMEELEGEAIVVRARARVTHKNDSVIYCWIPNAIIATIMALYTLIHASILTHGFIVTCNEYRTHLVRQIHATGEHAVVIHSRLTCSAILDFMDFLVRDNSNSRRGEYINTGASLHIAIVAAWATVAIWIYVVVLASKRAYKERDVMTCCGN